MKQVWPNYSYSPTTNVLTLTGLNIDRDQLLLVSAPERGRIMYNFADSTVTASAFTAGANTGLTLVASTAGLTTTAAFVIYYDDQASGISVTVTTVSINNFPATQPVTLASTTVTVSSLPALAAGTAQIGSVTASISGTVPVSISSVTIGNSVTIGSLPAISGTVTANTGLTQPLTDTQLRAGAVSVIISQPSSLSRVGVNLVDASGTGNYGTSGSALNVAGTVTIGNSVTIGSLPAISGTVTANLNLPSFAGADGDVVTRAVNIGYYDASFGEFKAVNSSNTPLPIGGTVTANLPTSAFGSDQGGIASDNGGSVPPFGVQIGYEDANNNWANVKSSHGLPVSLVGENFGTGVIQAITDSEKDTIRSSLWIADGSAINGSATEGQILSQSYPMPVAAAQGTSVTTSNFTSTTASTVLANFNATRRVLTIFNEGAGSLHICAGATCTTIAYQVRLSSGDYYEVPNHQTTITHSAVFATAGTARIVQIS